MKVFIPLLCALALTACNVEQSSRTLRTLCSAANVALPVAKVYFPNSRAVALAEESVIAYCNTPVETDFAGAAQNLAVTLGPVLRLIATKPAALAAFKSKPEGMKAWKAWQELRK